MKNRLLLYITAGIILLALAMMVDRGYKDTYLLQEYADEVGLYTASQQKDAANWVQEHQGFLEQCVNGQADEAAMHIEQQALAQNSYTILLFRKDTLLFWSNERFVPVGSMLSGLDRLSDYSFVRLPGAYYAIQKNNIGNASLVVLQPIRYTTGHQAVFPANPEIPALVGISADPTDFPVQWGSAPGTFLTATDSLQAPWVQMLKLSAYALLMLLVLIWLNKAALWLSTRFHPLVGLATVALAVGSIYFANNHFKLLPSFFSRLALFGEPFATSGSLGNALGDWFVYTLLLLWLAVFFHRSLPESRAKHQGPSEIGKATAAFLGLMLGVLFCIGVLRQLVLVAGVESDFGNFVNINGYGLAAMTSIVFALAAVFLVGHKLMLVVKALGLSRQQRMVAQIMALLLFCGLYLVLPATGVPLLFVAGFAVLYTVLFDYFIHWETPGFGWIVLWLLLYSIFAAFLLNRFQQRQEHERREQYARALSIDRDSVYAEPLLRNFVATAGKNPQLGQLLKPWPFKPTVSSLRQYFNQYLFNSDYLFDYYQLQVYAFDKERQGFILEQTSSWQEIAVDLWDSYTPLPDAPQIRYGINKEGAFQYVLRFPVDRMQDPTQSATVFCILQQEFPQTTRMYARHFYRQPYKGMEQLSRYDFAVLRDGKLAAEQGQNSLAAGSIPLAPGAAQTVASQNPSREDVVVRSTSGTTVAVLGRAASPWYRQVYLFAILFTLASLVMFALALLNPILPLLPAYFGFFLSTKGSLSRRIYYWNIALVVFAFLAIGIMTYTHFNTTNKQNNRANFDYRSEAVLTNLRTQFHNTVPGSDTLTKALPEVLGPLSTSLALDMNFYAPNGDLLFSDRQDLRELGLVPAKLSVQLLDNLRGTAKASIETNELLAGQPIENKYLPLRNAQNQLLGYLSIPFNFSDYKPGPEVSDFMGMLASLYVFLLLIAGTATLALARTIIKPVRLISEKIKELRFEDKNQPLEYQGDHTDELGELIQDYNRMVDKLEDSKIQMIRLEREGAWREMARQIAHDIKNPLTTMKLSMQQLERVSNDPMQAAAYLKKAITRLIEQIDSLAQIASEFSMFANLEIRQRHEMVLNDVVESVHDLFAEQKEVDLQLNLPKERFLISGDKNHLIRVFNNLIINAIQAIPPDRKGQIQVMLYRQGNDAIVQIRDNGGGIPPDIQVRVFEPNFTTKSSGSGLGLAICRRIVEALDGTIRFETRQGEGTDFFVALPITGVE
ncbi:MAG: HAMP domain-containing histidine kinase [Lewinellaceae bacterium]|nr:HAMP domain-containing histidine kinase [Lewinellaceae bacterium]